MRLLYRAIAFVANARSHIKERARERRAELKPDCSYCPYCDNMGGGIYTDEPYCARCGRKCDE